MLNARIILTCLARTWCIGAVTTSRGMQHLGFLFALNPALTALYPDPTALAEARRRYLPHTNTHPFMAPLFVGLLICLEQHIAQGRMQAECMEMLVRTTATTLSALGDSFCSGTVLVFWALSTSLCLMTGFPAIAASWTVLFFLLQAFFRIGTFFLGVRTGLAALQWIRCLDLINWGDRLKLSNALLLSTILWVLGNAHAPKLLPGEMFCGMLCLAAGALLINRAHFPRVLLAGLMLTAVYVYSII